MTPEQIALSISTNTTGAMELTRIGWPELCSLSADYLRLLAAERSVREPQMEAFWRVGSRVPVNIYRGDVIAGQAQTPELALELVNAANAAIVNSGVLTNSNVHDTIK